jgi:hypothetical protein
LDEINDLCDSFEEIKCTSSKKCESNAKCFLTSKSNCIEDQFFISIKYNLFYALEKIFNKLKA